MDAALKVVVDIVNKDAIKKLQKDVEDETRAVQELNKQFIQGTITAQQFGAASLAAGDKIVKANTSIKELGGSAIHVGRSLGQLSYAIDDIQYGFNAIVNNIPQIVMAMGGGMGLAGAIGIAAVAVNQLIQHWTELSALLQSAWTGQASGELLLLAERAETAAKAFEKLAKVPTSAQAGQVSGVGGAVTEAGVEGVTSALAAAFAKDPAFRKKAYAEAEANPWESLKEELGFKDINRNRDIGDAARKEAEKLVGGTQAAGPAGEAARLQLEAKLRGMGEHGLADQVRDASPERQKEIAQKNLDLAGGRQGRKQEDKALDDAKKFGKAEADEWRKGVEEAQKHLDAENKRKRIEALEDQRKALLGDHHQQDLLFDRMRAQMGNGSQSLQGPKAVVDFYQKSSLDSPIVALAKAQKDLQEKQLKELQGVNAKLEKERRVRPT